MQEDLKRTVRIVNKRGLHARAAARFVKLCEEMEQDATVEVWSGETSVGGTSIMGLLMLGAAEGTELELRASGKRAGALLDALEKLVADRFGEEC